MADNEKERSERVVDLRDISDDVLASSARLREVEAVRRETDPLDPRFRAVSAEARRLATELVDKTAAETKLTREVAGRTEDSEAESINKA